MPTHYCEQCQKQGRSKGDGREKQGHSVGKLKSLENNEAYYRKSMAGNPLVSHKKKVQ